MIIKVCMYNNYFRFKCKQELDEDTDMNDFFQHKRHVTILSSI